MLLKSQLVLAEKFQKLTQHWKVLHDVFGLAVPKAGPSFLLKLFLNYRNDYPEENGHHL